MLFYVIILGFGALAGVIINILINQKDVVYTVIGSIVILLTGAFACFVLYYPFYFDSFRSMLMTLSIGAVFFIVIYIALRLLVNAVSLRSEPLPQLDAGSASYVLKQPANVRVSRTGANRQVKSKAVGTVEVTRLNKTMLQAAKNANPPAAKSSSGSMGLAGSARADKARQAEPAQASFKPGSIPGEMSFVQRPEADPSDLGEASFAAHEPVHQSEAVAITAELKAEYVLQEALVHQPEATADAQADEEPAEIAQEAPIQQPEAAADTQADEEPAEIAQEAPVQQPEAVADAQANGEPAEIAQEAPVQQPEAAADAQADEEPAEIAQETPIQQPVAAADVSPLISDKYSLVLDKAVELMRDDKYAYAAQLLTACLSSPSSLAKQKHADILLMECLVLSEQYDQARKKWLEVLNKMYILEPSDKLKLKQILIKLDNINRKIS